MSRLMVMTWLLQQHVMVSLGPRPDIECTFYVACGIDTHEVLYTKRNWLNRTLDVFCV